MARSVLTRDVGERFPSNVFIYRLSNLFFGCDLVRLQDGTQDLFRVGRVVSVRCALIGRIVREMTVPFQLIGEFVAELVRDGE
jgi:hypothetical protein